MKIVGALAKTYFTLRKSKLQYYMQQPLLCQQQMFEYLMYVGQQTAWGQTHGYEKIKNQQQYAQRIPVQTYETLQPYIERIMAGEPNVLWHTPVRWFAKSSGTTADKSKFIPISTATLDKNHYRGARDVLTLYSLANPRTQLFDGKGLVIGGSHQISHLNPTMQYGDLSAVLAQNMPNIGHYLRTPDLATTLMPNWDEKLEKIVQITRTQNVVQMAGVPTWTLLVLKRLLELTKAENIGQIWKNFELYLHGGVSFTPYEQQFAQLIGKPTAQFWQTYNASEGFFALQDQPHRNDMLLLTDHAVYYEFMPLSELNAEQPRTLQLHEVEVGQNYALTITTYSGLWRYMIGDTIQFTTLAPYRIRVTGRTKHYINVFGEEVMVGNTDAALSTACTLHQATVTDYTVAPIYLTQTTKGGHEWLVEFDTPPARLDQFAADLDAALQQLNTDYQAKRHNDMAMQCATVVALPKGTFYRWLQSKGKLGGQNKVPRLFNTRQYIDDIKQFTSQL